MDLDDWRSRINNLDEQILDLLNQRAEAALQIGELKDARICRTMSRSARPSPRSSCRRQRRPAASGGGRAIWREILSACRALEHR